MIKDVDAVVTDNREVARDTYLMTLDCALEPSVPGQFVMVKIDSSTQHFLRRPLAILKNGNNIIELLYKTKGQGTLEMSKKRKGEILSVLGPLGQGFGLPDEREDVVFVAGGTGLPPILALAEQVRKGHFIFGARSRMDIPLWERIEKLTDIQAVPATEDGSLGRKGFATDAFEDIAERLSRPCVIYACGPEGMLKKVYEQARQIRARCWVSLEEHMACGFGVCSACAVKTSSGIQRVCTHGPVFDAEIVRWSA